MLLMMQDIELLPDFEVVLGAEFHAFIDGCGNLLTDDDTDTSLKENNDTAGTSQNVDILQKSNNFIPLPDVKPSSALISTQNRLRIPIVIKDLDNNIILETDEYDSIRALANSGILDEGQYKAEYKINKKLMVQYFTISSR